MTRTVSIPVSDLTLARLAALRGMPRYSPALLARWDWALTHAAAPCPPLSASGQLEHSRATAVAHPPVLPAWAYQSAMKGPG